MIDSKLVQQLRQMTGAGIVDCKKALEEANGDLDKAQEILRKKGQLKAAKKLAEREAKEGVLASYIHATGKVGVLLELNCETDFVARNDEFKQLASDLALHVAAANPMYVRPDDMPTEVLEKEKEIIRETLGDVSRKPKEVIDKIVEGKLAKLFEETCLLNQLYVRDDKMTIADLINSKVSKIGEKIAVKRFVRFQI
ncbi:translation elongation factor Ts [Candidatus Uhrbacteria bacterium]|nr:translation elongation factor Ts [Candidatus Uhrbacteria bacterium]